MFAHKKNEKKIVMAFGTFDYFHAGHENYLKQAAALGDYLIVVIARDRTARQIKGTAPLNSERKRASIVRKSGIAGKVILGEHGDKHKVLKKYRPDVIALGYDQFVFTQKLRKTLIDLNLDAEIKRLDAHFPQVYKSSLLKNRSMETETAPVEETAPAKEDIIPHQQYA
jgi:FAD synthetase